MSEPTDLADQVHRRDDIKHKRAPAHKVSFPMLCALADDPSCSDDDLGAAFRLFLEASGVPIADQRREDVLARHGLVWWGSDCDGCGNTTPESACCEECGSSLRTRLLWIDASPAQNDGKVEDNA